LSVAFRAYLLSMRSIETNGVTLAVDDRGEGYPVVLLHGFPEFSYSWRYVAPALQDAGFRVVTYDLRGSGGSSGPEAIDAYGLDEQSADLIGILDRLGIEQVAVLGHDWGSIIAYAAALRYPERISHVMSLNVPHLGWPAGFPSTDDIRDQFSDRLGYVLSFQEPGATESRFAANPQAWMRKAFAGVSATPDFQSPEEFGSYVEAFTASGLTGLLNLYRNIDRNIQTQDDIAGQPLSQPALLVTVDSDPVLPASLGAGMARFAPDLEIAHISECGHWTQQEQPNRLIDVLLDWMVRKIPG
jgi:pimeloyl-ACP methyl ester carboxylesterase